MNHGTCVNFNGAQHDLCKRGVAYKQFRDGDGVMRSPCIQFMEKSARGGTYLKPGEVAAARVPWHNAAPPERCPFFQLPTDAEVEADRIETDAHLQKTFAAIKVASTWRVKPKPAADRQGIVECPICKGRLHLSQSSYNGHVRGKCETDGCVSWME